MICIQYLYLYSVFVFSICICIQFYNLPTVKLTLVQNDLDSSEDGVIRGSLIHFHLHGLHLVGPKEFFRINYRNTSLLYHVFVRLVNCL